MNVAVIPARGGSKRIPRKNVRDFCGRPMLAWAIEKASESNLFEHIVVSTDDDEIASVATQYGAEVPFLRPPEIADDFAGTVSVIAHATRWMLDHGIEVRYVCCIYATASLLWSEDLRRGLDLLESGNWAYVFSATEYASPIFRSFRQLAHGGIEMLFPENRDLRSQDMPAALHDAAQFYWGLPASWLQNKPILESHSAAVHIPRWRVQDVDTESDWRRAERLHRIMRDGDLAP